MTREELEAELVKDVENASNVLEAVIKNIYIRAALNKGAPVDWCNDLRKLALVTIIHVVGICYGFPELKE